MFQKNIIVALDNLDLKQFDCLIDALPPTHCRIKVGLALFLTGGSVLVQRLLDKNYSVFLDLKFHDIPMQVAKACRRAADFGVDFLTVHAQGGAAMIRAAREALDRYQKKPALLAVTLLTSLKADDLASLGLQGPLHESVVRYADMALKQGADGLVSSPNEVRSIRQLNHNPCLIVTPGIRLNGPLPQQNSLDKQDDQARTATPEQAIQAGADYLVVGRPITHAPNPFEALCGFLYRSQTLPSGILNL